MKTLNTQKPIINIGRTEQVTYIEHRILFGLLSWKTKVSAETLHDDLIIFTNGNTYNKIFVDGKIVNLLQ